jgi:hypothetical protein
MSKDKTCIPYPAFGADFMQDKDQKKPVTLKSLKDQYKDAFHKNNSLETINKKLNTIWKKQLCTVFHRSLKGNLQLKMDYVKVVFSI